MRFLIIAALCILSVQAGRYGTRGGGLSEGREYDRDRHEGGGGGYNDMGYGTQDGSESHNFDKDEHNYKKVVEDHSSHVSDNSHKNYHSSGGHSTSGHHNYGEGSSEHGSRYRRLGGGERDIGLGF